MFGIGFWEIVAIGIIALIFIGPEDLPRLARQLARFLNELKYNRDSFVEQIQKATDLNSTLQTSQDTFQEVESSLNQVLSQTAKPELTTKAQDPIPQGSSQSSHKSSQS